MEQDKDRRILFVEGLRDVSFWKMIVPLPERGDTVVYAINEIELNVKLEGGERGKLMHFASLLKAQSVSSRVCFFADADFDRILKRPVPENVTLTDFRDLEAYGLADVCLDKLCSAGLTRKDGYGLAVFECAVRVSRPAGVLRVASERKTLKLPFQKTVEKDGLKRFLTKVGLDATLDIAKLIRVLLQNSDHGLSKFSEVESLFEEELLKLANEVDAQIIHGKDFTFVLAAVLALDRDQIERLLFLSLDMGMVKSMPNVAKIEAWIRNAPAAVLTT